MLSLSPRLFLPLFSSLPPPPTTFTTITTKKLFSSSPTPSSKLSINALGPLYFSFDSSPPLPHFEDLELYNSFGNKNICFMVHNLLSERECQELITITENKGYAKALVNIGGGNQKEIDDVRQSQRLMSEDEFFAHEIYTRLLHGSQKDSQNIYNFEEASRLNERLRFLKYTKGGFFSRHKDASFVTPNGKEKSYLTLNIYLNSPQKGGETTFSNVFSKEGERRGEVKVVPQVGMGLVFQHNILHEGSVLEEGEKYALRTDVMYEE